MEEIDAIILETLKNLHCEFDESVTSLKQFDAEMTVSAVSTCLEVMVPNSTFPKKLPPSMSLKLKITSNLAEQIKALGFRDDMGYQTILYCNEAEIRRVLMFLIERLPRDTSKVAAVEQIGYVPKLVKEIERKVKSSLEQFWVPSAVLNKGQRKVEGGYHFNSFGDCSPLRSKKLEIPYVEENDTNEALKQYWIHNVEDVTKQCSQSELLPSLLFQDFQVDLKDHPYVKTTEPTSQNITLNESDLVVKELDEMEPQAKAIEEIKPSQILFEKLKEQTQKHASLQEAVKNSEAQLTQAKAIMDEEANILQNTLSQVTLKTKTLTIISKEENLQKLQKLIENSHNKLISLADQWNKVQSPLLEEYKALQNTISDEDLRLQGEQARVKKLQETQTALAADLKEKNHLEDQLKHKLEQVNKNHNRSGYTRRILEIIGNIKKQDNEIGKILKDTKCVQREISALTGQVERSFTLSDELIFRDAKQDETARKSYKLLAQLRDECASIIKAVTDLGSVERECRNLQDQIDSETSKENAIKLDRVNKDLQEIRKETELLLKQVV